MVHLAPGINVHGVDIVPDMILNSAEIDLREGGTRIDVEQDRTARGSVDIM